MSPDFTMPGTAVSADANGPIKNRADEAEADLSLITRAIGHDLRAPLRGISGFAKALQEDYGDRLDAAGLDYLSRIRESAGRMDRMIEALLALARVARADLSFENADVSHMASDILTGIAESRPERRVTVEIDRGLVACSDRILLRLMLKELLDNAWKFTAPAPGARIRVSRAEAPPGRLAFVIRDNGAGFDAEAAATAGKLFGAFEKFHRPGAFPGEGAGLAIATRAAEKLGGDIKVESRPDAGASFICEITDHKRC